MARLFDTNKSAETLMVLKNTLRMQVVETPNDDAAGSYTIHPSFYELWAVVCCLKYCGLLVDASAMLSVFLFENRHILFLFLPRLAGFVSFVTLCNLASNLASFKRHPRCRMTRSALAQSTARHAAGAAIAICSGGSTGIRHDSTSLRKYRLPE